MEQLEAMKREYIEKSKTEAQRKAERLATIQRQQQALEEELRREAARNPSDVASAHHRDTMSGAASSAWRKDIEAQRSLPGLPEEENPFNKMYPMRQEGARKSEKVGPNIQVPSAARYSQARDEDHQDTLDDL